MRNLTSRATLRLAGIVVLAVGCAGTASAQWSPPDPTNLQVLPKGTSGRDVVGMMKGFTQALGVRCQNCHVYKGGDANDLTKYDFASDERDDKRTARAMLRMLFAINGELLKGVGEPAAPGAPKVTCYTCHRGETEPQTRKPTP